MKIHAVFRFLAILLFICLFISAAQVKDVRALLGDVDISGLVDLADMAIIDAAYAANTASPNWDVRADINLDDLVSLKDLALAGRSFASTFNFLTHRRISNGRDNNPALTNPYWCDAVADQFGRIHVIWEDGTGSSNAYLYYTQLDAAGNALIEDVLISNDSLNARLAVGPDGSAHIVYRRHYSDSGLYYISLGPDGSFWGNHTQLPNCATCDNAAIAVDAYNHAHIAYSKPNYKALYTIVGENGQLLPAAQLNPGSTTNATAFSVAVSKDGARHILWRQATGVGGGELRYTRINSKGEVTANNRTVATLVGSYTDRFYYLTSDFQNAVHLLYYDFRASAPGIYWARIDLDGSKTAERLVSNDVYNASNVSVQYAIDTADNIHLVAPWSGANGQVGYARLDRNGNALMPFQRVAFEAETNKAVITVDSSGQAMIVAPTYSGTISPLFLVSTMPDPASYDPNRADLVLDKAHLVIADQLLKINELADITVTITNGGPAPAANVELDFSFLDVEGSGLLTMPVGTIAAFTSVNVHQLIPVPDFDEVDAWEVSITVRTSTAETSTGNNTVIAPFGIVPPPRMFNIEVSPFDETYAPDDRAYAEPLPGATLTLECALTSYKQQIEPGQLFNVFWDVPLNTNPANAPLYPTACEVTLTKEGYSTASSSVTAQRFSVENPYAILLAPRPLNLYINTWGEIRGTIMDMGSSGIENALVKLNTGQETRTDAHGNFVLQKIPAGNYTLRIWAAKQQPIDAVPVAVTQGKTTTLELGMQDTERADVFGVVRNDLGLPLMGALVQFFENGSQIGSSTTGGDGSYSFSVDPFVDTATYRLDITCEHYEPSSINLVDLMPGIPLEENIVLVYIDTGGDLNTSGNIKSWVQDERWCKAYGEDEDLPLRVRILQAIGSKWCPSFQTVVNWGAFDYELGLNFTEDVSGKTVSELLISFSNEEFISYDVSSGRWHSGGETYSVTAQRIDWVELIAIDSNGNPVGTYTWHDERVFYSSTQTDPVHPVWRLSLNTLAPTWSQAAIRIYYTIGQYDEMEEQNFKDWNPPADLGLQGSGSPSGADRQVITWMLSSNTSSMRYSLADYRSALYPPDAFSPSPLVLPQDAVSSVERAVGTLSVVAVTPGVARVGVPYAVDIVISGFETRPVYALQFDLDFNQTYLRLVDVQEMSDFAGLYGSWHRVMDLQAVNTAGILSKMAVVRLAAPTGLADGRVLHLVFMPVKNVSSTTLNLTGSIDFADIKGDLFDATSILDLSVTVDKALIFLPLVIR